MRVIIPAAAVLLLAACAADPGTEGAIGTDHSRIMSESGQNASTASQAAQRAQAAAERAATAAERAEQAVRRMEQGYQWSLRK